jgi:transcriptional regulator with XRE-family HTH domain
VPPRPRRFDELLHRRDFGERIHALRMQRGWSQENLAEAADLHRTYVNRIERGLVNISIDSMQRLANGLGMDLRDLFEHSERQDTV